MAKIRCCYRFVPVVACLSAHTAMAGTVTTEGPDVVIKTRGGLEVRTADRQFSFDIGGRVQVDYNDYNGVTNYRHNGDRGSDLFFRRARIYISGTLYGNWGFKAQYNIAGSGNSDGSAEDLYVRWKKHDMATVTVGKQKEPFGLQELTSSKWVTAIERAESSNLLAPGRNVGINLAGHSAIWGYSIGAYKNGNRSDSNELNWAVTGRAYTTVLHSRNALLSVGAGYTTRDYQGAPINDSSTRLGVRKSDSLIFVFEPADRLNTYNLEIAGKVGSVHAQAEYFSARTRATFGSDAELVGYYAQIGWFVTGESRPFAKGVWQQPKPLDRNNGAWEVFARYDHVDLSDNGIAPISQNRISITTLGVNWYINDPVRLSADYVHTATDGYLVDPITGNAENRGDAIAVRLQLAY